MDRRSFLALIAAAPIAALAPWSKLLELRGLCDDWYLDPNIVRHPVGNQWPDDVIRERGYLRRGVYDNGDLIIELTGPDAGARL